MIFPSQKRKSCREGKKAGLRGKRTFGIKFLESMALDAGKDSGVKRLSGDGRVSIGPVWCQCPGPLPTPGQGLDGSVAWGGWSLQFQNQNAFRT
jgi:hypothetical protein